MSRPHPRRAAFRDTHVVVTGEPVTGKLVRRVREEGAGKGLTSTSPASDLTFLNPLDAGAADTRSLRLYDWGHAETVIHREVIWAVRAAAFAAEGLPLPRCQPTTGFWDRFTFDTDTLLVADSNAYAGPLAWEGGFDEVVVFDAHHDCGYRRSYSDYVATGEFTCEDWTYPHHEAGAAITVRYPPWRRRWPQLEPSTGIPAARHTDDGGPLAGAFTAVFACRSGGWVPAWCDDQWQEFIDAFPGPVVSVDPDLRPRWPVALPGRRAPVMGR